jgi:multisubunit Na+/H+ antiporter MnhB subunit
MPSPTSRYGFLAVVAVGTLLCASILLELPQLRLVGATVPTQFVVGVGAGVLTLALAVSEFSGGHHRSALQFALLGVGVPLALSGWRPVAAVGALLTLLSVPVAWQTDRWLRDRFVDGAG